MSYADPEVRPLLDLEGLKQWLPGRTEGYALLAEAVDRFGYLDDVRICSGRAMHVDLEDLGFDRGGALLVKRALARAAGREIITVARHRAGSAGASACVVPRGGARVSIVESSAAARLSRGPALTQRWSGAERAGRADPLDPAAVVEHPPQRWGLAARGALVEAGSPEFHFALADKVEVWSADAVRLYAQAAAAQWDPATAIPWDAEFDLPDEVEDAVVQIMTYLVENETAALIVPSRFIAQLHPHFREVMQVLAIQAADEARHIEVFTGARC